MTVTMVTYRIRKLITDGALEGLTVTDTLTQPASSPPPFAAGDRVTAGPWSGGGYLVVSVDEVACQGCADHAHRLADEGRFEEAESAITGCRVRDAEHACLECHKPFSTAVDLITHVRSSHVR